VLRAAEASDLLDLPVDRIGDLVVLANHDYVLGTAPADHDLTGLDRPLRSHGGLSEQAVPLMANRLLIDPPGSHQFRNFDAFWLGMNFGFDRDSRPITTGERTLVAE
jgi:phosphonoacetate hydrolase